MVRRICRPGRIGKQFDPSPIKWEIGRTWLETDDVALILTNEPHATIEYTAVLKCLEDISDVLFRDYFTSALATKLLMPLSWNPDRQRLFFGTHATGV